MSDSNGLGAPTRFSFYNADDYKESKEENDILKSLESGISSTSNNNNDNNIEMTTAATTMMMMNPYEDAIKEALDLLRRHRTVLTAKSPATSSVASASTVTVPPQTQQTALLLGEAYQAEIEARRRQRQERMAKYASRLAELKQLDANQSQTTDEEEDTQTNSSNNNQVDVQRGVERVLLAILERANSTTPNTLQQQHQPMMLQQQQNNNNDDSGQQQQPYPTDNELVQAMSELIKASSSETQTEEKTDSIMAARSYEDIMSAHSEELDELVRQFSKRSKDDSIDERLLRHKQLSPSIRAKSESPQGSSVQSVAKQSDNNNDERDPHNDTIDRVLGPLNRSGGTTGVVLEPGPPAESPTSTFLESLSAAVSFVMEPTRDRYTATSSSTSSSSSERDEESSQTDGDDDDNDDDSFQAVELMKSLCSHLLPGLSTTSTFSKLPPAIWDEGNPDEPGYRIVRLSNQQLRRIEQEFERVKAIMPEDDTATTYERDLKAAEQALEHLNHEVTSPNSQTTDVEGELEHFPGVKPAGKGEMGDLEYFHLPIIFKSHVTGFEPTKDLFLEPGNIVAGQYLVEGELGSAAFSTAYRCVDLNSEGPGPDGHQEVCLKVIKNTKDYFDQSLDEIKILELLRQTGKCHEKHIVEMKTFFYHREHLIIVTELLRQNLFEFGKFIVDHDEEPYFTLPRLGYITRQTLVALDFIHQLGLVHSDVKPENILLRSYSRAQVKLIDFGSSCYLTDRQSSYIQSRSYRAPEVILGFPYDGRIDIWSLGCVVAEMYTGEVTLQNDSIVSMLSRIEAICGPFPKSMISQGRQSGRFFTKCGLLFERVTDKDEDEENSETSSDDSGRLQHFDIFQPKTTTIASRLGFEANLMERYDSGQTMTQDQTKQALFVDFVRKLLTVDPERRPTAAQALQHPWMKYAALLTEEDIKYPSG